MATGSEIRAVLFDAVGTLIELREPVGETYARMARPFGVALPAWRVDDAFRRILKRAPPLVFPDARDWDELTKRRGELMAQQRRRRSGVR